VARPHGKEGKSMRKSMLAAAALAAAGMTIRGDPPLVSNVTLAQPEGTRLAVVAFVTDGAGIATFQFKTGGVDVVHSEVVRTVTGDINTLLSAGTHTFTWDAGRDFPERLVSNLTAEVTLWATNSPPPYCAVNLVADGGGRFPVRWYGKEGEVPFGAADGRWKKDWLLLRQIPSTEGGTVTLGSPGGEWGHQADEALRTVRITRPFYMGVYEVTQRQWENVAGATRSKPSWWNNTTDWEERPVEQVSYYEIRENASSNQDNPDIDWPGTTNHAVAADSFMGRLRAKTGDVLEFDLPTEAQWEYACRAGTTGPWNNGAGASNNDTDPNLAVLGRYQRNGGQTNTTGTTYANWPQSIDASKATATVGSYLPNAWGLHDMHGNVWEWCLDYYIASDDSLLGDDPSGPELAAGSARVRRGGSWGLGASDCRSARRRSYAPSSWSDGIGFRVAAVAAVWMSPVGD
jgi:formylglycine-generating enzyme required for sulfatase activity